MPAQPPPLPTGGVGQPVGKVVPSSANSKIIHPEDDVSLEELKAKKYKHLGKFRKVCASIIIAISFRNVYKPIVLVLYSLAWVYLPQIPAKIRMKMGTDSTMAIDLV